MARLTKRHRLAIARGVRRYWRKVKTRARTDNTSVRDARARIKVEIAEEKRAKGRTGGERARGWTSPDPEGEAAFNLKDRDALEPPPWTPRIADRFRGQSIVRVKGYWEYRENPASPAVADDYEFDFDPGGTNEEFWSYFYEALRDKHDEILEELGGAKEKYERFGIFVTRIQ